MQTRTTKIHLSGFTLIELSIVMVIIGLIIVGIFSGQTLVIMAQVRNVVSQVEKIDSAVTTFRTKYDGVPGDFSQAHLFFPGGVSGNGDSQIRDGASNLLPLEYTGELPHFWIHLSDVSLIPGEYTLNGTPGNGDIGDNFPLTELGKGGGYRV